MVCHPPTPTPLSSRTSETTFIQQILSPDCSPEILSLSFPCPRNCLTVSVQTHSSLKHHLISAHSCISHFHKSAGFWGGFNSYVHLTIFHIFCRPCLYVYQMSYFLLQWWKFLHPLLFLLFHEPRVFCCCF